ncbi:hypothetical protein M758_8G021300 [Ceratodon purpureus]|nr:hypothetical protein M758_8G021300 [Ceratodon purpureus]
MFSLHFLTLELLAMIIGWDPCFVSYEACFGRLHQVFVISRCTKWSKHEIAFNTMLPSCFQFM